MPKLNKYTICSIIFALITWLFVGLFRDDEFYEPNLFVKYRPTFKVNFYSPIGMQDLSLNELSPERREEEIAFQNFIINQQNRNNHNLELGDLPYILIQLTLTFFCFGILKTKKGLIYKKWQWIIHFGLGFLLTGFAIIMMMLIDIWFTLIAGSLLIVAVNYFLLLLLTLKNRKVPVSGNHNFV
ncbi:hypothetical protein ACFFLS_00975 [Flavobacterium procerum]|uniref:Uncharacterized protein n=1 Tax=Flavobacterium procerum TaxID=1455569 RepID=A0ABV6BNE9_9FLAO